MWYPAFNVEFELPKADTQPPKHERCFAQELKALEPEADILADECASQWVVRLDGRETVVCQGAAIIRPFGEARAAQLRLRGRRW